MELSLEYAPLRPPLDERVVPGKVGGMSYRLECGFLPRSAGYITHFVVDKKNAALFAAFFCYLELDQAGTTFPKLCRRRRATKPNRPRPASIIA